MNSPILYVLDKRGAESLAGAAGARSVGATQPLGHDHVPGTFAAINQVRVALAKACQNTMA